ncbi:MAG: FkbM family methyltransferase [Candidatus Accumulibacter sp.]|nr:FkbM family methyltransferase [Accumulibacter sp.]
MKKLEQLLSGPIKQLFANCPFLRGIELSMRFRRLYKNNFGYIKFQGQSFQDMMAFLYLKKKKKGFYMDIGAHDGIGGSNTYVFEQIGWDGICIEPQPDIYNKLRKYRKCSCYNVALSSTKNDGADFFKTAISGLSGLDEGMPESRKQCLKEYGKTEIVRAEQLRIPWLVGV